MTKVSDERRTDRELSDMIQSLLNHGEAGYTYVKIDAHLSALRELQSLRASIPGGVGVKDADLRSFAETVDLIAEGDFYKDYDRAIAAIDPMRRILSALTERQGEAVAWQTRHPTENDGRWVYDEWAEDAAYRSGAEKRGWEYRPLYASPSNQEPVAVTDEMVEQVFQAVAPHIAGTDWREVRAALTAALSVKPQSGENG